MTRTDLRPTTFVVTHTGDIYEPPELEIPPAMSRMERYHFRKQHGLCVQCGRKLYVNNLASRCARCKKKTNRATKRWRTRNKDKVAKQKAWLKADRKANPEKYARMQRKRYHERQRRKICVDCTEAALPGHIECQRHLDEGRAKALRYYRRKGRARRRARQRAARKARG